MGSVLCAGAVAQQTPAKTTKPAAKPAKQPATTTKPATPPLTPGTDPALPSKEVVEAFYHRMFGYQDNLKFQVADIHWSQVPGIAEVTTVVSTPDGQQVSKLFVTADGKHAISGDMIPFGADPFASNREMLKDTFGPVRGSDKPAVKLVEFADLECPGCKAAQPIMDRLLAEVPNAQLVFQSFPLEKIHPWARQAASYLDCLYRDSNEHALTFMEAVFTHQSEITPENATTKLNKYVELSNGDPAKVSACAATPETKARIDKSLQLGQSLQLTGTPTLFVNGRPISGVGSMPFEVLKSLVEFEATQSK